MAGKKRKGFFALDVDQFERAADLGLEPATAYLALMAGTDQSNTVSAWGINAIVTHTGLTRHEAKHAVTSLAKNDLLHELEGARTRARTKPRYSLPVQDKRPTAARLRSRLPDHLKARGRTLALLNARDTGKREGQAVRRLLTTHPASFPPCQSSPIPSPPISTARQRVTVSSGPRRSNRLWRLSGIPTRTCIHCQPMLSGRVNLGRLSGSAAHFAS